MRKRVVLGGMFVSLLALCASSSVDAGNSRVERTFRGKVILMKKRAPARFRSQGAFIRFLKVHRKKHIWPDKKNKKQWSFEFMAFFRSKLNDLEVKIKFYDITKGKKFIAADTFYTPSRGQKILASKMVLEKPRFTVNRKYKMLVLSARNVVLSSTIFWLRGQRESYSGKVTFTDEEAKLK